MMRRIHKSISWLLVLFFIIYIIGNQGAVSNSSGSDLEVESLSHPCLPVLNSVSWNPNSSLALIGVTGETAYLFNGQDFELIWFENDIYTFYCNQWNPDGSYALLGSDWRIYKYDGTTFTFTEIGKLPAHGYHYIGIDWKPNGSEALIIGHSTYYKGPHGAVIAYDGIDMEIIHETQAILWDAAWKPDGSYALIVGEEIIKYDGLSFSTLYSSLCQIEGVSWKPDGSYALLVGGGSIWKYNGISLTELYSNITYERTPGFPMSVSFRDVAWNPDGSYALIVGGYGRVYKYDENSLVELHTDTFDRLNDVDWRPDGKYALIMGETSILRYPSSSSEDMIEAIIDINPDTLNLKSKGRWITCYITLPVDYDVNDIDISTILLEDSIPAEWGDIQGETLMVKFDRSEVEDMLSPGTYNLKVAGELTDGTKFEGYSDEIRVIEPL